MMNIENYFNGKSIFITGGSGFMGKILIEKLLRTCPDIKRIYLLLRKKSGKNVMERRMDIINVQLFDNLKKLHPGLLEEKIVPIDGDVSQLNLGISSNDRLTLINEISILFHVASSIRFIEPIKSAIIMNIRGTRDICKLALEMTKLEAFQYVSTAYSNLNRKYIDEILYKPQFDDWKKLIEIAENCNEEIEYLVHKMLGLLPNTYVFTKSMAEHVVNDLLNDKVPAIIIRPSIVISTAKEPIKGWVDNFNGPVSVMIGGGKGLLRTVHANPKTKLDYIPVDDVIKGMIIAVWKKGNCEQCTKFKLSVYNASSNKYFSISMEDNVNICNHNNDLYPYDNQLWHGTMTTSNYAITFWLRVIFQHLTLAFVIDVFISFYYKKKPIFVKILKQIYQAHLALRYYMFNEWNFVNKKFLNLQNELLDVDAINFKYELTNLNMYEYFEYAAIGFKRYLLKDDMLEIDKHKMKSKRMKFLHYIVLMIFYGFSLWIIYQLVSKLSIKLF